jgi:hypothetical protein|tara:strand:+ start:3644 stop:4351 length:708 start_codon:yes stop_codon:yes gene_type:complete
MALPKLNVPSYTIKLPSTGDKIKYRPFLVKEEKLLYLAMESGDQDDMIEAVTKIMRDCTNISDVRKLATFDIEYLFLKIRTRSVGENVDVVITCPDDEETEVSVSIPLDEIEVIEDPKHKTEIQLNDDVIITMKYPSLEMFVQTNFSDGNDLDEVFKIASNCAETIQDRETVHHCADLPKAEIVEFFESMNSAQFKKVQEFFETMPKLSHTLEVENPNTGVKSEVVLEGLASFFA